MDGRFFDILDFKINFATHSAPESLVELSYLNKVLANLKVREKLTGVFLTSSEETEKSVILEERLEEEFIKEEFLQEYYQENEIGESEVFEEPVKKILVEEAVEKEEKAVMMEEIDIEKLPDDKIGEVFEYRESDQLYLDLIEELLEERGPSLFMAINRVREKLTPRFFEVFEYKMKYIFDPEHISKYTYLNNVLINIKLREKSLLQKEEKEVVKEAVRKETIEELKDEAAEDEPEDEAAEDKTEDETEDEAAEDKTEDETEEKVEEETGKELKEELKQKIFSDLKPDKKKFKKLKYEIREEVLKKIKKKLPSDKMKTLKSLVNSKFTKTKLSKKLEKLDFTQKEIEVILNYVVKKKKKNSSQKNSSQKISSQKTKKKKNPKGKKYFSKKQ